MEAVEAESKLQLKRAMRARMRSVLASIPLSVARSAGERLALVLAGRPDWSSLCRIATFSSLSGEIDTKPLIEAAWRAGIEVVLPRMVGRDDLEFAEYRRNATLVAGSLGVDEPGSEARVVPLAEVDWVIVPGLAFDGEGGRLGRGAGYYDRAFAASAQVGTATTDKAVSSEAWEAVRPTLIGAGFALQMVGEVPTSSLDVRMDAVATELEWHAVE